MPTNRILSPIRVRPGLRHFVDRGGDPAFFLGDTQWELFRSFEPGAALQVLRDRARKGISIILVMLLGVDVAPEHRANLHGELPWVDGDPLQPNERYFAHIDPIIHLGEQTGQTLIVGVYHKWHTEQARMPLEKARGWARWVARRYHDVPNLIWSMYPIASAGYIPICRELAAGLQEGDGGAHLISVHPDPSVASSSFMHDEPWLAFNMIQTCVTYDQIYATVTADYARTPVKPVVMAEGGYEGDEFGHVQDAHAIRKQAYWTALAGGYHIYGHNEAWTAPERWREWLDSPGSRCLRVFRDVIAGLDGWHTAAPDPSLIAEGARGGYELNLAMRAASGAWALAYLSEPGTITLDLRGKLAAPSATAVWIDPATGNREPAVDVGAAQPASFTSPAGWEDALLLVA